MEKRVLYLLISISIILSTLVICAIVTFFVIIGCGWNTSYKCHFIPFLTQILAIISCFNLLLVIIIRRPWFSVAISIFQIVFMILFFIFVGFQDPLSIGDSYFVCELSSKPSLNYFGHSRYFLRDCMTKYAVQDDDSSYCDKIEGDPLNIDKFFCYSALAKDPTDSKLCEKIDRRDLSYDRCYFNIANSTKDSNWCSYISPSTYGLISKCAEVTKN